MIFKNPVGAVEMSSANNAFDLKKSGYEPVLRQKKKKKKRGGYGFNFQSSVIVPEQGNSTEKEGEVSDNTQVPLCEEPEVNESKKFDDVFGAGKQVPSESSEQTTEETDSEPECELFSFSPDAAESAEAGVKSEEPVIYNAEPKTADNIQAGVNDTNINAECDSAAVEKGQNAAKEKAVSTFGMFWFLALMSLPVINLIVMLVLSFKPNVNKNYRAVSRAWIIWFVISVTTVLTAVTVLFFLRIPIDLPSMYENVTNYIDKILL